MTNTPTKIELIKAHLLSGKTLTQLESIGLYSAFRLAARVFDLKKAGWDIITTMKEDSNGSPYAEYKLAPKASKSRKKKLQAA